MFLCYILLAIIISIIATHLAIKYNQNLLNNYFVTNCNQHLLDTKTGINLSDDNIHEKVDNYFQTRSLVSPNVDQVLEEIVDYSLRDYLFLWYKDLVTDCHPDIIELKLKNEIFEISANIVRRMSAIDSVKFFTHNIVNRCIKHFQKITLCLSPNKDNPNQVYLLSAHLTDEQKELEFVRKLSDFLLTILLPKSYAKTKPLRQLLREIISVQLLYTINLICDPIYLNQKLLDYLKYHKMELEKHRQTYAYAETYEDFIKMINHCCDVEDLKRIRFQVITEIMEATVINNLKKERGIDLTEKMFSGPITSAKGDQLQARNLKRYINQLTFAKNQCEKRFNAIHGETGRQRSFSSDGTLMLSSDVLPQPNRKTVLGFKVIMNSDICRSYMKKFMHYSLISSSSTPENRRHLIVFWESIEQMSKQEISRQYEIANEILNNTNFRANFIKLINLSKNTLKAMEEFVLGNRGPEAYFIAQTLVYDILEHRYYPLFIVSKEYDQMLDQFQEALENTSDSTLSAKSESVLCESDVDEFSEENLVNISDNIVEIHVSQTKLKLENLTQKLNDKRNALKALKKSETEMITKSSLNVNQKLIQLLEKEVDGMVRDCCQLESHLECTEMWISGMGKWRADVHNIELDHIDGCYLAIIIVFRSDMKELSSNGWIVARNFQQFCDLKRRLCPKYPNVKRLELPKPSRKLNISDPQLKVFKQKLQLFLNFMATNEKIYRSEELFLFLSQSADSLRQPVNREWNQSKLKSKMYPLAKLFGINKTHNRQLPNESGNCEDSEHSVENQFLILNGLDNEDNTKDDIAEPLYDLISEIFELKTVSKWLRRSLVTFVQMTFGQTINKQLRSTCEWFVSESMVHYYLTTFRDSLWPNGQLCEPWPQNSPEERQRIQMLAKHHLMNSIPEVLNNLLGQQNVKKGVSKVFDGLQNQMLNKQMFYELIETFMFEFAPELKSYHI